MIPFPPVWLSFRSSLWIAARLLPVFAKHRPLDEILQRATPKPGARAYGNLAAESIVTAVKTVVAHPWRMRGRRCLREGLLAFHYLALAGHRPILHLGLVPGSLSGDHPRAHCWLSVDGETVLNPPLEKMVDLFSYDGHNAIPAETARMAGSVHD